jgi:hypothetical protein
MTEGERDGHLYERGSAVRRDDFRLLKLPPEGGRKPLSDDEQHAGVLLLNRFVCRLVGRTVQLVVTAFRRLVRRAHNPINRVTTKASW